MSGPDGAAEAQGRARSSASVVDVATLFVLLMAFYHVNGALSLSSDVRPHVVLPISLLSEGNLTFTPREAPALFRWHYEADDRYEEVYVHAWKSPIFGETAEERLEGGELQFAGPRYYLAESSRPGEYVNAEGIGAGLTALPVFAVLHGILGDLRNATILGLYAGKAAAAAAVAGSAVFVFLIASLYVRRNPALLVALTYGLGTCVWSTSSQGLWPHGPAHLFLAMGAYFFLRARESHRFAALCGASAAGAILCQPVTAAFALVAGVDLLWRERRRFPPFFVAGSAIGFLHALYNQTHLGGFWRFGSMVDLSAIALATNGDPSSWRFDILESAAGLLVSPSRGLLVYSPVLAFALVGLVRAWRNERYERLRPFAIALGISMAVPLFRVDWWGGWSYGYRPWVDSVVLLSLFLIPVVEDLWRRPGLAALFAALGAWSVFVQALGAFAETSSGWNNRLLYHLEVAGEERVLTDFDEVERLLDSGGATFVEERSCDVDDPRCGYRLWSISDSQIAYYLEEYERERLRKRYLSSFNRAW